MESVQVKFYQLKFNRNYVSIGILFLINLLNYMDRYTIAGVLTDIQTYFNISNVQAGLLQTVFICSYMIFAPICGFLGDRYSRKLIMIVGILVWSSAVLLSSFIKANNFWTFFFLRGVVGIGEASYSTVSPAIIADLFTQDRRSRMLMVYYFAIPVGSGLGFVIGANIAAALGSWQWGIRFTPILGCVCVLLLIFILQEPKRGAAEDGSHLKASSWMSDVKFLFKNRSFIWSTLGFVCIAFAAGCISWWAPSFVIYAKMCETVEPPKNTINLIFGVITCLGGFTGVTLGSFWATKWRRTNPRADPLVCGIGLILALPFYFLSINLVDKIESLAWILMYFAVTCLSLNWAVLPDILLYIMIPPRRATANAMQLLIGHLLGDASSPYIIGQVSDAIAASSADFNQFLSLKYALYIPSFALVLGGLFFMICAMYVEEDKRVTENLIHGVENETDNDYARNIKRNDSSDRLLDDEQDVIA